MKKTVSIIAAIAIAIGLSSCAGLEGTTIGFSENGFTITPPARPIVIPVK